MKLRELKKTLKMKVKLDDNEDVAGSNHAVDGKIYLTIGSKTNEEISLYRFGARIAVLKNNSFSIKDMQSLKRMITEESRLHRTEAFNRFMTDEAMEHQHLTNRHAELESKTESLYKKLNEIADKLDKQLDFIKLRKETDVLRSEMKELAVKLNYQIKYVCENLCPSNLQCKTDDCDLCNK